VLKKAKAAADFNNFGNFIFILPVPLPTHHRQRKHYCSEPYIAGDGAKKSSLGKGSSQFATRRDAGTRSTVLRRQISEHIVWQRLVPANFRG
jgi:hypothetical protein